MSLQQLAYRHGEIHFARGGDRCWGVIEKPCSTQLLDLLDTLIDRGSSEVPARAAQDEDRTIELQKLLPDTRHQRDAAPIEHGAIVAHPDEGPFQLEEHGTDPSTAVEQYGGVISVAETKPLRR